MFYAVGMNMYNIDGKFTTIHAEVDALLKLKPNKKKTPKKINMIIFRVNNTGTKLMMARPCCNCQKAIREILVQKNYKLKKCWFTNNDGEFEQFIFK
jgi:deoxycytidylate deaminase